MVGTEFIKGQGLGNQLFCYVSSRCIAQDLGYEFGTAGQEQLAVNIHSKKGMYFMDMDLGIPVLDGAGQAVGEDKGKKAGKREYWKKDLASYHEREERLYLKNCVHDMTHGCYVAGADDDIYKIADNTLLYGNLQSERYFAHHRQEIKGWLKVKEEYDSYEYTRDNLCILNVRGGEYVDSRPLFLRRKYWLDAMRNMRKIREDMEFMIVTEDVRAANWLLPELEAHDFGIAGDYAALKNARYLVLSNSSFAFFPVFTSETVREVIAPKYWARHNVSDGYWASEQNIYEGFRYQDRSGKLFCAEECREELEVYKGKCEGMGREGTPFSGRDVRMQERADRLWYWAGKAAGKVRRSVSGSITPVKKN